VADTEFAVVYDGPGLADGLMSVRDLAPALLALGDLFVEASRVTYPERDPVGLNIRATAEGSFLVQLVVHSPDTWDQIVHFFSGSVVTALLNLKDIVIGGTFGLVWLIKRLRGRGIVKREPLDSGQIRLMLDDHTTIEVPAEVLSLYDNLTVRRQVRQVVEPLERPGIDRVRFISDERITVEVEDSELAAFEVHEPEEQPLSDYEHETVIAVATVSFAEGYKWRFTEGDAVFTASIEDPSFRRRIDDGEPFRKGDALHVRMRVVQTWRGDPQTLRVERTVLQVLDHIPRAVQTTMDDWIDDEED
jgi:hypothetical protein